MLHNIKLIDKEKTELRKERLHFIPSSGLVLNVPEYYAVCEVIVWTGQYFEVTVSNYFEK